MTHGSEAAAIGAAVGAGSLMLELLGVSPDIALAAAAACYLGAPKAAPVGNRWLAIGNWCAAVVVTCHAARGVAAGVVAWMPTMASHEGKVQALAAVVIGVAVHVLLSHVPGIVSSLLQRFKLTATDKGSAP